MHLRPAPFIILQSTSSDRPKPAFDALDDDGHGAMLPSQPKGRTSSGCVGTPGRIVEGPFSFFAVRNLQCFGLVLSHSAWALSDKRALTLYYRADIEVTSSAAGSMAILEVCDVHKNYGSGAAQVAALRGLSVQINSGEFVAIMGPSGSGKSTLLTILGGVESPTSGKILLEGVDLAKITEDERTKLRRRRLGFVFQSFNLLPNLSAEENVSLPMELDGRRAAVVKEQTTQALELVEMTHRRTHLPSALSGGEQQRIAIARALAIQPAILLADEPTGNLDSRQSGRISTLLQRLVSERGQTIVMVTHDPHVAKFAKRLITIRDGLIEHDGEATEVLTRTELLGVKE